MNKRVQDLPVSFCFDRDASNYEKICEEARPLLKSPSIYERGLSKAMVLNDLEAAESEFSTAINQSLPTLSKYYFQRGNVRFLQKKYEGACRDYSEALKLDPKIVYGWTNKGAALGLLGTLTPVFRE